MLGTFHFLSTHPLWRATSDTGPVTVLSISFEVDVPTGKVGGSLLFEWWRRELPRGGLGACPPQKILKFRCLEMLFSTFSRQYLGLKNNQNYAIKVINHILCFLQPFFSSKSQSPAFRKEWNDKSSNADSKNTFNVLSSCSPFERTCSAMSASVSLAQMPFWQMQKPGI